MRRASLWAIVFGCIFCIQACVTTREHVWPEPGAESSHYQRVVVLPFESKVGILAFASAVEQPPPGELQAAVIESLKTKHASSFTAVESKRTGESGELVVAGRITRYDGGSRFWRAIGFPFSTFGAGALNVEVYLADGAGKNLEAFRSEAVISSPGLLLVDNVYGAMKDINDLVSTTADKIADRVAAYGAQ